MEADQRLLQTPVLVLNASYEPINITPVRRAVVLVLKGVATTEEEDGDFIHAARAAYRVPSVIRLREFRRIPARIFFIRCSKLSSFASATAILPKSDLLSVCRDAKLRCASSLNVVRTHAYSCAQVTNHAGTGQWNFPRLSLDKLPVLWARFASFIL